MIAASSLHTWSQSRCELVIWYPLGNAIHHTINRKHCSLSYKTPD